VLDEEKRPIHHGGKGGKSKKEKGARGEEIWGRIPLYVKAVSRERDELDQRPRESPQEVS